MARKRMLDPSIWEDPDVCTMQPLAIILFIGLVSHSDDDGRGIADPRYLRKAVFGFNDEVTTEQVGELLIEIDQSIRGVVLYEVEERKYYALLHWEKYQKVSHPKPSTIPSPVGVAAPVEDGNDAGAVFRYWESTGQLITSAVAQELTAMIKEWDEHVASLQDPHSDKKITGIVAAKEAIRVGVKSKTRPHINYVWGILKNWITNGYMASSKKQDKEKEKPVKAGLTKDQIRIAREKSKKLMQKESNNE